MCGIAGKLNWSAPPDGRAVAAMTARLAHRGPDAEGAWRAGPIALGHRRLTVIDPTARSSHGGGQLLHDPHDPGLCGLLPDQPLRGRGLRALAAVPAAQLFELWRGILGSFGRG
jgi:hypothetical protein